MPSWDSVVSTVAVIAVDGVTPSGRRANQGAASAIGSSSNCAMSRISPDPFGTDAHPCADNTGIAARSPGSAIRGMTQRELFYATSIVISLPEVTITGRSRYGNANQYRSSSSSELPPAYNLHAIRDFIAVQEHLQPHQVAVTVGRAMYRARCAWWRSGCSRGLCAWPPGRGR